MIVLYSRRHRSTETLAYENVSIISTFNSHLLSGEHIPALPEGSLTQCQTIAAGRRIRSSGRRKSRIRVQ